MSNFAQLKAAFAATSPDQWDFVVADNAERPFCSVVQRDAEGYEVAVIATTNSAKAQEQADAEFIVLARNNMAALLGAAELLKSLTFIAESVAHLQGFERDILPTTDAARGLLATLEC